MRAGYHAIWSDVDVVWFRDPTPLLAAHPQVPSGLSPLLGFTLWWWSTPLQIIWGEREHNYKQNNCETSMMGWAAASPACEQRLPWLLTGSPNDCVKCWGKGRRPLQRQATSSWAAATWGTSLPAGDAGLDGSSNRMPEGQSAFPCAPGGHDNGKRPPGDQPAGRGRRLRAARLRLLARVQCGCVTAEAHSAAGSDRLLAQNAVR